MSRIIAWLEQRFNLTEMFSFLANFGLFPTELDTRKPVAEAVREALSQPLHSYARWPRVLGILSFLLFLFLGLTGLMLAFYYQPSPGMAYESVTILVRDVSFGWFVHQIHGWAANALLLILLVRAWRFYFQGMYKTPREAFWMVAVLTFLVAINADMTGRLLSWTASGYWSTVRSLEIFYSLPGLGALFAFLIGGHTIDAIVLVRFYFLHVVILPLLLLGLFFLNFSAVRRVGLSAQPEQQRTGTGALRVYLYSLLILVLLIFGTLVTLATVIPAPFDQMADPFVTPKGARPPWYLLASHAFYDFLPAGIAGWLRGMLLEALLAGTLLLPFLDRSPGVLPRDRRVAIAAGLVVLVAWLLFTWHGYQIEAIR